MLFRVFFLLCTLMRGGEGELKNVVQDGTVEAKPKGREDIVIVVICACVVWCIIRPVTETRLARGLQCRAATISNSCDVEASMQEDQLERVQ